DDAQVRLERREGIVGDLGARAADGADEGALADVGKAEQAHVRHQLELEPQRLLLPGRAGLGPARGTLGGGGEVAVAPAAAATLGDDDALVGPRHFDERVAGLGVEHHRAERQPNFDVLARPAVAVLALAGGAGLGADDPNVLQVVQGRPARVTDQHDVATPAPIAPGGTAERKELLAPEGHAAVAAAARFHPQLTFVDEPHAPPGPAFAAAL